VLYLTIKREPKQGVNKWTTYSPYTYMYLKHSPLVLFAAYTPMYMFW